MRNQLLILLATIGLIATATAAAATPSATTASSSEATESGQAATWTTRKLAVPLDVPFPGVSCDDMRGEFMFLLRQLGARVMNLDGHEQDHCRLTATFSVLVPAETTGKNAADAVTEARWQTVELRTGTVALASGKLLSFRDTLTSWLEGDYDRTCYYLKSVTTKVLPWFSVRDVKLISETVCEKYGVGLRAQVLMPTHS